MSKRCYFNSCYGALGQEGFRFFERNLAEAITLSGQLSVKWAERKFNEVLNKLLKTQNIDRVCAVDTDSCYLNLSQLVSVYLKSKPEATDDDIANMLDMFAEEKLQPYIRNFYDELKDFMNAYENRMKQKREAIAVSALLLAKKKYAFLLKDLEGVRFSEPKLKVTGIEIVRSSTPQFCRDKLKTAVTLLLKKDLAGLRKFVVEVEEEFKTLGFDQIGKPSGANNINDYVDRNTVYKKGTPIHVRGCILYNNLVKDYGLERKYRLISGGDKIKFCYLKMPNPIYENIIACPDVIPPEFGLDKYIDYKTQFEKVFLSSLELMMKASDQDLIAYANFSDLI